MTLQTISYFFPKGETGKSYYGSKELLWHQFAPICIHRWPLWRRRKCMGIAIFYLLTKNVFLFRKYFTGLSCPSVRFLLKLTPSQYSSVNSSVRRWYQEVLAECRAERPGREESHCKSTIKPVSTVSTWGLFPLGALGITVRHLPQLSLEGAGCFFHQLSLVTGGGQ